jgi:hypothetical protein
MKIARLGAIGLVAAMALTIGFASDAEAKRKRGSCAMAAGEGSGVTEALARTNASNALANVVAKTGGKRTGAVKTTCTKSFGGIMTTCTSSARSCK